MRAIFSRIKLSKKQITLVVVFMLITSIAEMMLPTLLAQMIDNGVTGDSRGYIIKIAIAMMIVAVLSCFANIMATVLSASVSTKFGADLRSAIFSKVQTFSEADMDKFDISSLITRSTSDVSNIQIFLSFLMRLGVMAPLMAVAGLVLSSVTGGAVSSVLSITIPVLLIVCGIIVIIASSFSVKLRQKLDRINQLFLEALEGVRVIRAFNKQEHEIDRFQSGNEDYTKTAIASNRISGLLTPAINLIFGVTTAFVVGIGAYYVYIGEMEVGSLIANTQYINMILLSIIMLTAVVMVFPTCYACAKRIAEVLNTEPSINDGECAISDKKIKGTVEFRNVTFAYPKADEPVLKGITFKSKPGEITAIIGSTGCGKSSILKLIPRMFDTLFGEVYVDGINVKDYKVQELRNLIGYVPQKNVLFTGDIAYNLNFGNEIGCENDWKTAAQIACSDEFIEKKAGTYHAEIAQGGTNLSGGQRQRMAIARAVMKKPEIYLFDDSFSALDMKTDKQLRQNLKQNIGDATVIMVAQRVSSIIDADRILVINNGEIVGNGTHSELLVNCPLYREIAEIQLGKEAVENEIKNN